MLPEGKEVEMEESRRRKWLLVSVAAFLGWSLASGGLEILSYGPTDRTEGIAKAAGGILLVMIILAAGIPMLPRIPAIPRKVARALYLYGFVAYPYFALSVWLISRFWSLTAGPNYLDPAEAIIMSRIGTAGSVVTILGMAAAFGFWHASLKRIQQP